VVTVSLGYPGDDGQDIGSLHDANGDNRKNDKYKKQDMRYLS
jgi:hypothetical protein